MYRAIPHLSPIGLSVIHQADEKHVECYIPTRISTGDPIIQSALMLKPRLNQNILATRVARKMAKVAYRYAQASPSWPKCQKQRPR